MELAEALHHDHGPNLSSDWIRANMQAAAVIAASGLAADLVGMAAASKGLIVPVVVAVLYTIGTTFYARQTGRVLAQRLPAFSMRGWLGLHVALGLCGGGAFGAADFLPGSEGEDDALTGTVALVICVVLGAALAALFAAVQALVLRKAVRNVGSWIKLSALGGVALGLWIFPDFVKTVTRDVGDLVIQHAVAFLIYVIMAIVLLPAVQKFQPR